MHLSLDWPHPRLGRAVGKVILIGEHVVVHGASALALPVPSAFVEVTLAPPGHGYQGPFIAQAGLEAMAEALGFVDLYGRASVRVSGPLPLGAGMGGSAALAAAFVRALQHPNAPLLSEFALAQVVHRLERIAHGTPSGLDGACVCFERPLYLPALGALSAALENGFRLAPSDLTHAEVEEAVGHAARAWLFDLKAPSLSVAVVPREGSTREAVAKVADLRTREPATFVSSCERLVTLSEEVREALAASRDRERWLGLLFREAQQALAPLGITSARAQAVITAAERAGAYGAKISGAGMGGAVLIAHPLGLDLEPILRDAGASQVFTTTRDR